MRVRVRVRVRVRALTLTVARGGVGALWMDGTELEGRLVVGHVRGGLAVEPHVAVDA